MASHNVLPGYTGIAYIGGNTLRCSSCSVSPQQEILFYNHILGLNDQYGGSGTKTEEVGTPQVQRKFLRPGPWIGSGQISFVVGESSIQNIFDYAKNGDYFDFEYAYHCEYSRTFKDCRANGFSFTVQAGEIATASLDVMCMDIQAGGGSPSYTVAEKLLTWDKVGVKISSGPSIPSGISGIQFKINNNCMPIYTSGSSNVLKPEDLRLGIQEVTGSVSIYLQSGEMYLSPTSLSESSISIDAGNIFSTDIHCIFKPSTIEGQVGPIVTELPFVGVDKAFES